MVFEDAFPPYVCMPTAAKENRSNLPHENSRLRSSPIRPDICQKNPKVATDEHFKPVRVSEHWR